MTVRKRVVCAWIEDALGNVLLSQRKPGEHLEHLWEFPGGKIEPGEDADTALRRELSEELGIEARIGDELARVEHAYADRVIELSLHRVLEFSGEVQAKDVAAVRWASPEWLDDHAHEMPPADVPLIAQVRRNRAC